MAYESCFEKVLFQNGLLEENFAIDGSSYYRRTFFDEKLNIILYEPSYNYPNNLLVSKKFGFPHDFSNTDSTSFTNYRSAENCSSHLNNFSFFKLVRSQFRNDRDSSTINYYSMNGNYYPNFDFMRFVETRRKFLGEDLFNLTHIVFSKIFEEYCGDIGRSHFVDSAGFFSAIGNAIDEVHLNGKLEDFLNNLNCLALNKCDFEVLLHVR